MIHASPLEVIAVWSVLGVAILGLLYAVFLTRQILREDTGDPKMREISEAIRQGAVAYLNRQLRTIIIFIAVLTLALFGSAALVKELPRFVTEAGFSGWDIALGRAGAFLMGSLFSLSVGQIGMRMAVLGNVRVAAAATRSLRDALRIAYRTGTITGMLTDGLGLLGGTIIFMIYGQAAPEVLLGFGFGGTLIALFMRVGGGIYTKAADVGADLVGKVEKDLPEDDPRNAAVIADLVGNTTKAVTKGIAIASAVIAAVSLFGAFGDTVIETLRSLGVQVKETHYIINIAEPSVFVGMLVGGSLPFLFSSMTIRAVGRAATLIVDEVRHQFRIPGVIEGVVKPDYAAVVGMCTRAAQRELVPVGALAVLSPILVGFLLHEAALGGFLAGVILSGQLMAVFMANAGGAWDNAKKTIEDEPRDPAANKGKGSERHKASVVGDTVGDPLKDTSGPALNPMIKVINLVSVLITPLVVQVSQSINGKGWLNGEVVPYLILCLAALGVIGWAYLYSKKESFAAATA